MMITIWVFLFLSIIRSESVVVPKSAEWAPNFKYHHYGAIEEFLNKSAAFFPQLASVYSIGRSVYGKELWVLKISSPSVSSVGTPHVKLIGNIHGNEVVGKEVLLHFIHYLLSSYKDNYETQMILNNTVLHIMPVMNPDGLVDAREGDCSSVVGRRNGNQIDLNRSFPDKNRLTTKSIQPETDAIINWFKMYHFVLSASLHGGALVANYPLDNPPNRPPGAHRDESVEAKSADDDVFRHLAMTYSKNHLTMHTGLQCGNMRAFPGGITNGAAWYVLTGGMQDYNYLEHGCMELTLEISCCKYPWANELPELWKQNLPALIALVKESHRGLRGLVLDAINHQPVLGTRLKIHGRDSQFSTSRSGEFWRILLPGDYLLQVEADGYETQDLPFRILDGDSIASKSTWLEVNLQQTAPESIIAENNADIINCYHYLFHVFYVILLFL